MSAVNNNNHNPSSTGDNTNSININVNTNENDNDTDNAPNSSNHQPNSSTAPRSRTSSYARKNKRRAVAQNHVYLNIFNRQIKTGDVVKVDAANGKQVVQGVHIDARDDQGDIAFYVLLSGRDKNGDKIDEEKYQVVKECEVVQRMTTSFLNVSLRLFY